MSPLKKTSDEPGRPGNEARTDNGIINDADPTLRAFMRLVMPMFSVPIAIIAIEGSAIIMRRHEQDLQQWPLTSAIPDELLHAEGPIALPNLRGSGDLVSRWIRDIVPSALSAGCTTLQSPRDMQRGTIIAVDTTAESLAQAQLDLLSDAAQLASALLFKAGAGSQQHPVASADILGPVFHESPIPMWVYAPTSLRFLAVNDAALASYGYSRSEFLAMTLGDIRTAEEMPRLAATLRSLDDNAAPQVGIWRHFRRNGSVLWVRVASRVIEYAGSNARLVWAHDITTSKELETKLSQQQCLLEAIADNIPDVVYAKDLHGQFIFSNPVHARLLGAPSDKMIGHTEAEFAPEFRAYRNAAEEQRVLNSGVGIVNREEAAHASDGTLFWLSVSKLPLRDKNGTIFGFVTVGRDITERRRLSRRVEDWEKRYRSLFEQNTDAVFSFDKDGRLLSANASCQQAMGYSVSELLERSFLALIAPEYHQVAQQHIHEALHGITHTTDMAIIHRSGQRIDVSITTIPMHSGEQIIGAMAISRDISRRKALENERALLLAETQDRTERDQATGLLNYRAFHKRLRDHLEQAKARNGSLAVALMDVDNFRFFNDAYGHVVGDAVLRDIGELVGKMANELRFSVLARYGGDEFALLLPDCPPDKLPQLRKQLENSLSTMNYSPPGSDDAVPFCFSVGLASYPADGTSILDLLAAAEGRLIRAKTGGSDERAEALRSNLAQSVDGFGLLDALVTAVDNKDHYTRRHSEDVLAYSLELAQELGLDANTQHDVQVAALLHDVGKIGIPDHILRKPGHLTDEEYQAIKQHPMMGAIMVSAVPGFEGALDATRHHHERWDGKGYPFGLVGEETPLLARLMAVADAYSAMTTDRPYRRGLSAEEALNRLETGAGQQWDPNCVLAFLHRRRKQCV